MAQWIAPYFGGVDSMNIVDRGQEPVMAITFKMNVPLIVILVLDARIQNGGVFSGSWDQVRR